MELLRQIERAQHNGIWRCGEAQEDLVDLMRLTTLGGEVIDQASLVAPWIHRDSLGCQLPLATDQHGGGSGGALPCDGFEA